MKNHRRKSHKVQGRRSLHDVPLAGHQGGLQGPEVRLRLSADLEWNSKDFFLFQLTNNSASTMQLVDLACEKIALITVNS